MVVRRVIVLPIVIAAACGDNPIRPTLSRADEEGWMSQLIAAARGRDVSDATALLYTLGQSGTPCPVVTISSTTATLTGGCTMTDGGEVRGSARVANPSGWSGIAWQDGIDTRFELDGFGVDDGGTPRPFDGWATRGADGLDWDADLTVGVPPYAIRTAVAYRCAETTCTLDGGVELVGVGGVLVQGVVEGGTRGVYVLRGEDAVTACLVNGNLTWRFTEGADTGTCPP